MNVISSETQPIENVTRIVTAVWTAVSLVNVVVWLAVSVASGDLDGPWFLYSFVAGGAVVAALRVATRRERSTRPSISRPCSR